MDSFILDITDIKKNIPEVDVIYTRNDDTFIELRQRTIIANEKNADLFISIHCDAFSDPQAHGCSSFVVGMNHGKQSRVAIKENPVINSEEDKLNYGDFDINSPEYQIEVGPVVHCRSLIHIKEYHRDSAEIASLALGVQKTIIFL